MKYVASHKGPSSVTFRTLFCHFGQTAIVTHVVCGNRSKFSDEKGEDLTFTINLSLRSRMPKTNSMKIQSLVDRKIRAFAGVEAPAAYTLRCCAKAPCKQYWPDKKSLILTAQTTKTSSKSSGLMVRRFNLLDPERTLGMALYCNSTVVA